MTTSPKVSNRTCIRRIGVRHMRAARARNGIAVFAIALTTILFTALFTIMMSIAYGYEQSTFRQVGSSSHGSFKNLTKEQYEELRQDSLIREYGIRLYLGMPQEAPFHKSHVEISYMSADMAEWSFLEPAAGRLPREGTNEAATDTEVLKLLGIEPVLGTKFTLTFPVDGVMTTREFVLCGYWERDPVSSANHILIPESLVDEILTELDTKGTDGLTGRYTLGVMFPNARHIEQDFKTVLERSGYQTENMSEEDTYIAIGINWGYTGTQFDDAMDFATAASVAAMLLLIMLTGYLIIYNLFQISVAGDIRFYGLLKTIGTTGRQIKRIIYLQAFLLSAVGIPLGLLAGYGVGALLTPVVLSNLNVHEGALSVSPWIFAGSALFSLITVVISCRRPGRIAAKVSPIEAVRYTEGSGGKRKMRRGAKSGASIWQMAWANLGRNRKKTVITVLSLSLSVVLLNITAAAAESFDLEKYLHNTKGMATDFLVADASYFRSGLHDFNDGFSVSEQTIDMLEKQGGITESGRTYGASSTMQEFLSEEAYRTVRRGFYSDERIDEQMAFEDRRDGRVSNTVQLYGMEPFCLEKLTVAEGDIAGLNQTNEKGQNYIAAVCYLDESGRPEERSCWTDVGDTVWMRYIDELEIYNTVTEEIYPDLESVPDVERDNCGVRILSYRDVEYEVAAVVEIPYALTYRFSGLRYEYILDADTFVRDTGTDNVLYYALDMEDDAIDVMERCLSDYTQNRSTEYAYESRQTYMEEYDSFTRTYVICGSALSFVVGLVGVLNFFNAILTGIMTRRREFAMLQSIGMTGRQLIRMLLAEGVFLALAAIAVSLAFTAATAPLVANTLGSMFTFFSYHFTAAPLIAVTPAFILLGMALPYATYRMTAKKSVVERLREAE